MKRHLLIPVALLLATAAWVIGCANQPISGTPRDEPTTEQAPSDESSGVPKRPVGATVARTATPEEVKTTRTPRPAPTATQVEPQEEAEGEEPSSHEESSTMTDTPALRQGDLPIFIEMTQATLLRSARSQSTPVAGRPNSVFAFIADTRTLLLRPAITVEPTTEVLVGVTQVIQGPTGELVMGRLFQVPVSGTPPPAEVDLTVADIERETGRLRLVYRGEILELVPGQRKTFKRTLADQGSVEITTISNRGGLAAIGSLPGEHSGR